MRKLILVTTAIMLFLPALVVLNAEDLTLSKFDGAWQCHLSILDKSPDTAGMKLVADSTWGRSIQTDDKYTYEVFKISDAGLVIKLVANGEFTDRQMMEEKSNMLIHDIQLTDLKGRKAQDVYLELRKKILPPVGASREEVEAVFGKPDREVKTVEPISNVPLPHHQYDVAKADDKNYFLCVKYDDSKAAWVYLANMDDEGKPGDISGREIDYAAAIRKLELIEALYKETLVEASWRK